MKHPKYIRWKDKSWHFLYFSTAIYNYCGHRLLTKFIVYHPINEPSEFNVVMVLYPKRLRRWVYDEPKHSLWKYFNNHFPGISGIPEFINSQVLKGHHIIETTKIFGEMDEF